MKKSAYLVNANNITIGPTHLNNIPKDASPHNNKKNYISEIYYKQNKAEPCNVTLNISEINNKENLKKNNNNIAEYSNIDSISNNNGSDENCVNHNDKKVIIIVFIYNKIYSINKNS